MIALITVIDNQNGRKVEIVSHGIDVKTLEEVILPNEPPHALGAVRHQTHGWILPEKKRNQNDERQGP